MTDKDEKKIVINIDENLTKKKEKKEKKKNKLYFYLGIVGTLMVFLFLFFYSINNFSFSNKKQVVIYELKGPIVNYKQPESIYLDKVLSDLDYIKNHYNGIILEIDSPGGDAYATKKIAEKLEKLKEKIPIVTCVDQVAASGAYWLASTANYIVADEFSVVGSIGVYASYLEFTGLIDKLGIKYNRIVFGKYKDLGSPFKNLTKEEKELLKRKISYIYEYFVKEVAKNRHLNYSYVKNKIATGEFFLGYEGKKLGLVDEFGDIETCKEVMAKYLNTSKDNIDFHYLKGYYERELNLFGLSLGYGIAYYLFEKLPNFIKIN
jgi:protease-4